MVVQFQTNDSYTLGRRRARDYVYVWNSKFKTRQEQAYRENDKLEPRAQQSLAELFILYGISALDPPLDYRYQTIRSFLDKADEAELVQSSTTGQYSSANALIDERHDPTGWKSGENYHHSRDWDGYASYPPEGQNAHVDILAASSLYAKLKANVRLYTLIFY